MKLTLVRVIDGDTVVLDVDLGFDIWARGQVIRLIGVDAPEVRGEEREQGLESKTWLEEQLEKGELTIKTIQDEKGKYGRWLGILMTGETNLNEKIVSEGFAEKLE